MTPTATDRQATTARPHRSRPTVDLQREATSPSALIAGLWHNRELARILARKEFLAKYRRASLGILWALGLPLLQSIVIASVFGHVVHFAHAPHYAVFVLSGMTAWTFFSTALPPASTGIVDSTDLSSRVYFPRAVLPLVQVASNLYGFAIALCLLLVLCVVLGVGLGVRTLLVLPATLLLIALVSGFALVTSALHVYFRDLRYLVTAAIMVWLYATPVIYPIQDAPRALASVLDVNPMTSIVDLFHAATVGGDVPLGASLAVTLGWTTVLLVSGIALHCRFDRVFADLL